MLIFLTTAFFLLSVFAFAADYYAVVNGGNWNAAATWASTSCAGAGGAGIPGTADNVTICSGINVNMNANSSCNNLYLNGGILNFNTNNRTLNVTGNFIVDGTSQINGTAATRILNVVGDFNVNSGSATTITGLQLNITGNTVINGSITFSSNTGAKTLIGLVTVNESGAWASTTITTVTNLIFQNGIINNGISFQAGACTFNTNNQNLAGSSAMSFANAVIITGVITVTNQNTSVITIAGVLNGSAPGSAWKNDNGSNVYYCPNSANMPMATGVLDVSTNSNVFNYSRNNNQSIKGTTYYNLVISAGGIKTLASNATINGDLTIENEATFNPAGLNCTVSGNTVISGTYADANVSGTSNLNDVDFSGGAINCSTNGIININGSVTLTGDAVIGQCQLTVNNPIIIPSSKTLTLNNNNGVKTFLGSVTVNNTATWTSTVISTATNLVFQGGINNDGTFNAGAASFSTNNQNITGSAMMDFANDVTVTGNITVNNQNVSGVTITGVLNGSVTPGSTWNNDINSILDYQNATQPMATGTIAASANPNTVYFSLGSAQTIEGITYHHLIISGGTGTKTLGAATTVNGDFTLTSATAFNPAEYDFAVSGLSTINGTFADGTVAGITTLNDVDLSGGTINGAATGTVNINGNLTMPLGNGTIGRVQLTVSGTTDVASGRILTLNSNTGVKTFGGTVTVDNTATWVSTVVTTSANLVFQNSIVNNGTSYAAGGVTFNTNSQSLSGSTALNFANPVTVTGITVTNNATVSMTNTAAGTLSGTGTWTQGSAGTLNYAGNTITISSFDASASGNTVDYNRAGAQTIFNTASGKYYNINFSTSGTKTLSSAIDVDGNLTIQGTVVFSVLTFDITVAGNWNNTSTNADPFTESTRTITFDGISAQNIFNTGNANGTAFNNVTVNNSLPVTALTLNAATTVNGTITLQDGHVITTAANILVLGTSASVSLSPTPDSSFVKGPMIQTYNVSASSVTKTFPIGKGNIMHRADLSVQQTDLVPTQYTGEFFYSSAADLGYTLPGTLDRVSGIDYWDISNGGAGNVNTASVTLYYFPDDLVTDSPNLRIAKSDGAGNWIDIGGTGTAAPTGTIASTVNFTTFSKFALGNNKGGGNPLPIELASFNATPENEFVKILWTTLTETNNDYFTVEKSKDAMNFETVSIVGGAGNSNELLHYSAKDYEPYQGISYYRLKQTDFDGKCSYSDIVQVNFIADNKKTSVYWWQDGSILLNLNINTLYIGEGVIEFYDYSGKLVLNKNITVSSSMTNATINTEFLNSGLYFIRMTLGNEQTIIKVIIC